MSVSTSSRGQLAGRSSASSPAPPAGYVQRGHQVETIKHTQRVTDARGRTKTTTRTVFKVDGKEVQLNWFERLRIKFMSSYEKQAFLAAKLLKQERTRRPPRPSK